jgi:predicted RNA binding protein YcfA (HicA-like mRNA interferase family)
VDSARNALNAVTAAGALDVARAVTKARASTDALIQQAKANRAEAVRLANAEIARVQALTRDQLAAQSPHPLNDVAPGRSTWASIVNNLGYVWESFASTAFFKYLSIAVGAAVGIAVAAAITAAGGGLPLLIVGIVGLLANLGADTYWRMSVDGQSFGQALWGAAVHDSILGQFYTFATNKDLETGTYQGLAWDQRLGLLADGVAQVVAARAGVRFGQFATGARCGLIRSCFVGGTPILTPDGAKAIEDLKVGDWVLSRDEHDEHGEVQAKRIEEVFVRYAKLIWLTIGDQRIGTTSEHPFWVVGKGWLPAGDLMTGDILVGHDGQQVAISAKEIGEWATVYNMRIDDWHTYFVGCYEWRFDVWAHNTNLCVVQSENGFEVRQGGSILGTFATQSSAKSYRRQLEKQAKRQVAVEAAETHNNAGKWKDHFPRNPTSGDEMRRLLEAQGWSFSRQNGSHMIMTKEGRRSVPVPNHRQLARGTYLGIIRQTQP